MSDRESQGDKIEPSWHTEPESATVVEPPKNVDAANATAIPVAGQSESNETPRAIAPGPDPEELYQQGLSFLQGVGAAKDEGQAIARFLDASDLGHSAAAFKAALMYFNGVGITRSGDEARMLAKQCLTLGAPTALVKKYCAELVDGSIGTENVRRLLEQDEETILQSDEQVARKKKSILLGTAAAVLMLILAALGGFFYLQAQNDLDQPPKAGVSAVISAEEAAQAKADALASIAKIRADAAAAAQNSADAAPARSKDF